MHINLEIMGITLRNRCNDQGFSKVVVDYVLFNF
jgi:hypothetical protein